MVIVTLAHHIDMAWMYEAYRQTRKDGATGTDEVTASEYAEDLDRNLRSLLERFKSGSYFAPPVRRVEIPKGDGGKIRPIGIPTFEDKVLQRPVLMVLEAVYEQDFCDFSYGFRPSRSAHQALDGLWNGLTKVLPKRFGKYGLALHPEKTRLIDYRRPPGSGKGGGGGKPPTFDFLGFTHYWGRSRKGNPVVKRKTAQGRFGRLLKRYPLPPPKVVRSIYRLAANPCA